MHFLSETHEMHVRSAQQNEKPCCGVKRKCAFSAHLSHFDVCTGYPADIAHDLFEGIVPVELAHCLSIFISKEYFTIFLKVNESILKFPYKWTDMSSRPHAIPRTFTLKRNIGGNALENWSLLQLLPFVVGDLVPSDEPVWQVILDLKDIVDALLCLKPRFVNIDMGYKRCFRI